MKHRERVRMALEHQAPDRCPAYIGFTPEFRARLRSDLQSKGLTMTGDDLTYEIERALDEDMFLTFAGWALSYYQEGDRYIDEWGIHWRSMPYDTPFGAGRYTEMVQHPLSDERSVASYRAPDPHRPELYTDAARTLQAFQGEYWIVGAVVCTILEAAWGLRGLQAMMMDFAQNPDLAEQVLEIPYRYHLAVAKRFVEMGVDMVWLGDDVGTQRAMYISPKHWRRYLKPRLANFIAELKALNPAVKVAYHSDGYIYPIIQDLIEIGLDVLNPVQPACMDPVQLKREFGDRLCFWGSVDVQHTLPHGSPEEVRAEVRQRIATLGCSGGLIVGPTHYVQLDTPMENFWAMVDAIRGTPCSGVE